MRQVISRNRILAVERMAEGEGAEDTPEGLCVAAL